MTDTENFLNYYYYGSKELKINELKKCLNINLTFFEEITRSKEKELKTEISKTNDEYLISKEKFKKFHKDKKYNTKEYDEFFEGYFDIVDTRQNISNQLNIAAELKIIYAYKSLEINIFKVIKIAYPEFELKESFKWENTKAFFKSYKIDLTKLEGYIEVDDLRKVNNNIKHSDKVSSNCQHILEFKEKVDFEEVSLNSFLTRIHTKVKSFNNKLIEEVILERYTFSDEKLKEMIEQQRKRMDKDTFIKYRNLLSDQYPTQN